MHPFHAAEDGFDRPRSSARPGRHLLLFAAVGLEGEVQPQQTLISRASIALPGWHRCNATEQRHYDNRHKTPRTKPMSYDRTVVTT